MIKKQIIIKNVFLLLSLFLFFSCDTNTTIPPADQTNFSAGADLVKGISISSYIQSASGISGTGTTQYSSSDTSVATVDSNTGEVNIISIGSTVITAENTGDENNTPATDSYNLTVFEDRFVTTWDIASDGDSITIPINNSYTYSYNVNWGDESVDLNVTDGASHTYTTAGTYTVKIWGTFPAIYFGGNGNGTYKDVITEIDNWGAIEWRTMTGAFKDCDNLTESAEDAPDLSNVTDMSKMFALTAVFNGDLNNWDVSHITDMNWTFSQAYKFNGNISEWDVSSVTDMNNMFSIAKEFNQNISSWEVSSVSDMNNMFNGALVFNQNLNNWNVSSVINMNKMFYDTISFNGNIEGWDVSSVTNMGYLFRNAKAFNQNLTNWDVSSVTNMCCMFYSAISFNGDVSWNTKTALVSDMAAMFSNASAFTGHTEMGSWNVDNVTSHSDFLTSAGTGNTEPTWP